MSEDLTCSVEPGVPNSCATNMGQIHLAAGDLVGAYRFFLPLAEAGDASAMEMLVEISERGGDPARAEQWRQRRAAAGV